MIFKILVIITLVILIVAIAIACSEVTRLHRYIFSLTQELHEEKIKNLKEHTEIYKNMTAMLKNQGK